jgi:hypothetical protein
MFEAFGWRLKLSPFVHRGAAERQRQPDAEGFDAGPRRQAPPWRAVEAGACYLMHAGTQSPTVPREWPWEGVVEAARRPAPRPGARRGAGASPRARSSTAPQAGKGTAL